MALSGTILNIVITLGVAVISLFILFLYLRLRSTKKSIVEETKNERRMSQCPDYWQSIGKNKCKNIHNIGNGKNEEDFNKSYFLDEETGDIARCNWAKMTNTPWQFIDKLC